MPPASRLGQGPSGSHPFADRRLAAMLGLGFSSGIPFLLVYVTQSAWLSDARIPIATLGLLSELTLTGLVRIGAHLRAGGYMVRRANYERRMLHFRGRINRG